MHSGKSGLPFEHLRRAHPQESHEARPGNLRRIRDLGDASRTCSKRPWYSTIVKLFENPLKNPETRASRC